MAQLIHHAEDVRRGMDEMFMDRSARVALGDVLEVVCILVSNVLLNGSDNIGFGKGGTDVLGHFL